MIPNTLPGRLIMMARGSRRMARVRVTLGRLPLVMGFWRGLCVTTEESHGVHSYVGRSCRVIYGFWGPERRVRRALGAQWLEQGLAISLVPVSRVWLEPAGRYLVGDPWRLLCGEGLRSPERASGCLGKILGGEAPRWRGPGPVAELVMRWSCCRLLG